MARTELTARKKKPQQGKKKPLQGKRKPQQGRQDNQAPSPIRPAKSAKFKATEDDAYCTKLCILIGPKQRPKESTVMLAALGLGPALRGYDKVDYALPVEQVYIQRANKTMKENGWKLPSYNIT